MVAPGTVLAGKYQVERVLGQGGMGCVVAAVHLQLGQRVAIKFLLPEALRAREAVERFLREARAAVRLRSEHVGRVIDVGQFDDGAPYMVMEYLDGMDLQSYLARAGRLPVVQIVDLVLQACDAIAEAHALGIVHRDLKPANLFLTQRADGTPLVKVLDFGISKASAADQSFNLTRTASVMGSPGYMSPEQLRSAKDCDARTDVWALGVILYELTTGRAPFGGESITELALRVAIDPTPPMEVPDVPPGFEAVVERCLGKDPPDRYPNVAELAAALVPFGPPGALEAAQRVARVLQVSPASLTGTTGMPGGPIDPRAATGRPVSGLGGAPTTLSHAVGATDPGTRPAAPGRGRRAGVIVGALAAAGIAAGVAVVALGGGGGGGRGSDDAPRPAGGAAPAPDPSPEAAGAPAAAPDAGAATSAVAAEEPPPVPPTSVGPAPEEAEPAPAEDAAGGKPGTKPAPSGKGGQGKSGKGGQGKSGKGAKGGKGGQGADDDDFTRSRY